MGHSTVLAGEKLAAAPAEPGDALALPTGVARAEDVQAREGAAFEADSPQ